MRRSPGLVELSRRDFCWLVGGAGAATFAGCTDGGVGAVQTGRLNGNSNPHVDAPPQLDAPDTHHDAATNVACTTTPTDVGAPASFAVNAPVYFSNGNFFVVKDASGFYALTAVCTHAGITIEVQGSQFVCPRHGATFDFDGNATGQPAFLPLVHYAMCDMSNGHLGVIPSMQVSQSTRLAG